MYQTITDSLANFQFSSDGNVNVDSMLNSASHHDQYDDDGASGFGGDDGDNGDMGESGGFGHDGMDDDGPQDFFTGDQAIVEDNGFQHGGEEPYGVPGNSHGPAESFDPRRQANERDLVMSMTEDGEEMIDYFNEAAMKNWAGPQHWKIRRVIRKSMLSLCLCVEFLSDFSEAATGDEETTNVRTKREKVPFLIDFAGETTVSSKELFTPAGKTGIVLPSTTGAAAVTTGKRKPKKTAGLTRRDEHLLPDDMHFSSAQLLRLFLKPKFSVSFVLIIALYWVSVCATGLCSHRGPCHALHN